MRRVLGYLPLVYLVMLIGTMIVFVGCDVSDGPPAIDEDASSWEIIGTRKLPDIYGGFFLDQNNGYIVGGDGYFAKTSDGGETFTELSTSISENLRVVHFSDANTGFAAGRHDYIITTTDGGTNWSVSHDTAMAAITYKSIFFISPTEGYLLGSGNILLYTDDGGLSWQERGCVARAGIQNIFFVDVSNGWAACANGYLATTSDGGESWSIVDSVGTGTVLMSIWVFSDRYLAGGDNGKMYTFTETDTGFTHSDVVVDTALDIQDIYFSDDMTGLITGSTGGIFKTTDGGTSWNEISGVDITGHLNDIVPAGANLFAVGYDDNNTSGVVEKSVDEGESWYFRGYGMSVNLHDVMFIDRNKGWVVGKQGYIFHTTDGGNVWMHQRSGTSKNLEGIFFLSDGLHGWAVGQAGRILSTTNGGADWTVNTSYFGDYWLQDVWFLDEQHGFLCGIDGLIAYTEDGGENWTEQVSGVSVDLNDIHFLSATEGYIAGANGTILHTTDGGDNWLQLTTGIYNSLRSMYFLSSSDIWVAGGAHWESSELSVLATYEGVGFSDENNGWLIGSAGRILHTIDGGESWYRQNNLMLETNINAATMIDPQTLYAVGDRGLVIKLVP